MSDPRTEALKALMPPNMRDRLQSMRAAGTKSYTVDEAMQWFESMAHAMDRTPRLPIHATTTREPDGSLTIRVTPDG